MKFEFSDLIAGYVKSFDEPAKTFVLTTSDGRNCSVKLTQTTYARFARNLTEPYFDATGLIYDLLKENQYVFVYGVYYPDAEEIMEAKAMDFPGKSVGKYRFEEPNWWITQAKSIADFFIDAQFDKAEDGSADIDYKYYRTNITMGGVRQSETYRQETDTISRLVYGFASTYLLTGEDIYLEAAEKGTQYLRDHMRFYDSDENIVYWYHGIDVKDGKEKKIFASEFGDDYDAIPMYEQIYALAGPTQTFRINGDPKVLKDIHLTIDLFDRFFLDTEKEGYYSHIDPISLSAKSKTLGQNMATKNWNSVGDHAPAYLINLWLATGDPKYKEFLKYTGDCIVAHFPDYENSPFVNERFFDDWSHDLGWGWQQNRAVVGHNLKIAWNLCRMASIIPEESYTELAKKIAEIMPEVGMDKQRGGWYDVVERELSEGESFHRFVWHDRKAWWQQEQGILAYQIMYGIFKDPDYLKYARESAAFYNAFFLDHADGSVYFNVLANGLPYSLGTERLKGSHSMSGYHSIELAYLSQVYTNLLSTKKPLDLYFKPHGGAFPDNILRVQPDILPVGSCHIESVTIDGKNWDKFNAEKFEVRLPNFNHRPKICVTIAPSE